MEPKLIQKRHRNNDVKRRSTRWSKRQPNPYKKFIFLYKEIFVKLYSSRALFEAPTQLKNVQNIFSHRENFSIFVSFSGTSADIISRFHYNFIFWEMALCCRSLIIIPTSLFAQFLSRPSKQKIRCCQTFALYAARCTIKHGLKDDLRNKQK